MLIFLHSAVRLRSQSWGKMRVFVKRKMLYLSLLTVYKATLCNCMLSVMHLHDLTVQSCQQQLEHLATASFKCSNFFQQKKVLLVWHLWLIVTLHLRLTRGIRAMLKLKIISILLRKILPIPIF